MPENHASSELSKSSVEKAYQAIKPLIHRTPVFTSSSLSRALPHRNTLYFKAENLQKGGAFKFRGASYSLGQLTEDELCRGVCTHSSGNHAGALALAARERGIKCFVVMPNNSAQPKIAAVRSYGAEITFCEPNAPARAASLAAVQERTDATFIPPYDAVNTILGQGTAFLELAEQVPEPLAAVIAPVGGGGLLAGDCSRCGWDERLREGKRMEDVQANTIADGLKTPVGKINFPIIQSKVESVIVVSDEEIIEAMRLLWERLKLVVEPSGAAAFAAARSKAFEQLGIAGPVGIILSGGNIDLSKPLPWVSQHFVIITSVLRTSDYAIRRLEFAHTRDATLRGISFFHLSNMPSREFISYSRSSTLLVPMPGVESLTIVTKKLGRNVQTSYPVVGESLSLALKFTGFYFTRLTATEVDLLILVNHKTAHSTSASMICISLCHEDL
ncbi:hypothetical protein NM688_g2338 [Phlebia brevispora]|uniref:Uncharacterized protein n=1 Tax=Phlebia brevispora TaxID=194682 RepID=A0ACC1T8S1_9APHY|nr:hypothetical protein NM688_g2338 [Phlebia brevispora]